MKNKLNDINKLIKIFINNSIWKQGYIHIEFCNGIHDKSWGEIKFRHEPSGSAQGIKYFKSLNGLILKLHEILELQTDYD